ncbi:hypothetical protein GGR50DRAFT_692655 [Xylaria sp. CBS 124048]|nr:hypothetical protein GGR50DRAFT_692655 [Xylaria sp. CBS 124048]
MYILKFLVPAMLAFTGLAQMTPETNRDDNSLGAQGETTLPARDTMPMITDDQNAESHLASRQNNNNDGGRNDGGRNDGGRNDGGRNDGGRNNNRQCRSDEYYDRNARRCRRYQVLSRPNCRSGERAYCGQNRRDREEYDRNSRRCQRRDGNRAFCSRQ